MILKRSRHHFTKPFLSLISFLLLFFMRPVHPSEAIRCDGALLGQGDLMIEVRKKCGEPADILKYSKYTIIHSKYLKQKTRKKRLVEKIVTQYTDAESYFEALKEFKKENHSHKNLTLENQKSKDKKTEKKATFKTESFIKESEIESIQEEYEFVWRCVGYEDEFEQWIYNLGSNKFIRMITFLRGKIVNIEFGDYGF
ncbi:MAG: DUF2845 domain-containing protein [Spirochaetia bacterium]|nr:DUF2845 domain-containing protein [Spirochaetia bacterium]